MEEMRIAHCGAWRRVETDRMKTATPGHEQQVSCPQPVWPLATKQLCSQHSLPADAKLGVNILHLDSKYRTSGDLADGATERESGLHVDQVTQMDKYCMNQSDAYVITYILILKQMKFA